MRLFCDKTSLCLFHSFDVYFHELVYFLCISGIKKLLIAAYTTVHWGFYTEQKLQHISSELSMSSTPAVSFTMSLIQSLTCTNFVQSSPVAMHGKRLLPQYFLSVIK